MQHKTTKLFGPLNDVLELNMTMPVTKAKAKWNRSVINYNNQNGWNYAIEIEEIRTDIELDAKSPR